MLICPSLPTLLPLRFLLISVLICYSVPFTPKIIIKTLVKAYITYVRPLLEYNTVIWSPYKTGDISSIEKVQRGFTKRLPGLKNLTYKERLAATNLDTLELRRLRTDLKYRLL